MLERNMPCSLQIYVEDVLCGANESGFRLLRCVTGLVRVRIVS